MVDVLPENIKMLRAEKGWSQTQLGEALGKKLSIVQKWENGTRFPSPDVIYKMSELFDVEFIIRNDSKHPLYEES